jgi:CheY-like chemotaxis protein
MLPRVLLAEESLPFRRVIREALTAFRDCEVDDTPNGEHAFELALRRPYTLFLFALPLTEMDGYLLDRLIAKAYPLAHPGSHTAPPVIFLIRADETARFQQIQRDARVRGQIPMPPKLDALLALTEGILPPRQGGGFPKFSLSPDVS